MSEQTSTQTTPASVEAQPPQSTSTTAPRSKTGLLSWFNLLLILLLSAALGTGGWFGWQHHHLLVAQLDFLQHSTAQHQSAQQQLQQKLATLTGTLQAQNSEIETLQQQLNFTHDQLVQLGGSSRQDWLIAEVEYLLRLANQRLHLERDWNSALALLQAADQVLLQINNPKLAPVREHLANEILALRKAPAFDRHGAILRLQSLQKDLANLPWLPEKLAAETLPASSLSEATAATEWYTELWQTLRSSLVGLVRIRERDKLNEGPLSPQQQYFLQQNSYLMLEQAQVALLHEEAALYQHSLERVQQWITRYLISENSHTQAVQQSLTELRQWQIAPERPDISQSLSQLQKLIEQSQRGRVLGGDA